MFRHCAEVRAGEAIVGQDGHSRTGDRWPRLPGAFPGAVALALALALALPGTARAQGLLGIALEVGGDCSGVCSGTATFRDFDALVDALSTRGYQAIAAGYNQRLPAVATVNYRGVTAIVEYPDDGPGLVFRVPRVNIEETFNDRGTRSGNERALEDYIRANEDNILSRILRLAVATTGTDPIAGNPSSLMNRMIESDFLLGTTIGPHPENIASTTDGYDRAQRLAGFNIRFGRYTADGTESDVVDLPLTYVVPLADPRYALNFDLPLTWVQTEGADSYSGSFGLGLRLPLLDHWTVTPAVRFGFGGSFDLGTAAGIGSFSLTSNYRFSHGDYRFAIGNSISYIQTFPIEYDDSSIDYDMRNVVLRNGIGASGPLGWKLFGMDTTWELSVVNTQFLGSRVHTENYTDIALSLGTVASVNGFTWDSMRLGLTYTVSSDSDFQGLRLNFGYQF